MPQRFGPLEAALPLVVAALLLLGAILIGSTAFYWPLAAGAVVAAILAYRAGYTLRTLGRAAVDGARSTFIALSILIIVGALIGVWKESGTVPALVYYGLQLANPRYLVPVAYILSVAVSMMLGTSLGTLSTIGVALMGVAQGVGVPLAPVAGALAAGSVFGDRSSPLSGSLNLNMAMTGADLRKMLTKLLPTGLTTMLLSLAAYLVLGLRQPAAVAGGAAGMRQAIAGQFPMSPWLLLPPLLVLLLAFMRMPVRNALGIGMVAGMLLAFVLGGKGLGTSLHSAFFGYSAHTGDAALDRMLSGGGAWPIWRQVVLLLVAGAFNGIMESTGMMAQVIARAVAGVRQPFVLVGVTMLVSFSVAVVAANQALAIIVTGRMLQPVYKEAGQPTTLLSRSIADSGTVLSLLLPWNIMALVTTTTLNVSVYRWAPYAIFAWLLPFVSLAFTYIQERSGRLLPAEVQTQAELVETV
ncbi:MAG: Na+/H+ antiporter NhaC family protein [Mycobacterium leprae]